MSNTTASIHTPKTKIPLWPFVLIGLLLILGWLGLKGWRIYQASQSLLARQSQIETLMADGPLNANPDTIEEIVMGIRRDVVTLKRESSIFMPLMPYLGWLPKVGSTAVIAPHLLEMADAGTEAAAYALRGLKPALVLLQDNSSSDDKLAQLVFILNQALPDLTQTNLALARLITARHQITDTSTLPWRIQTLLTQLDEALPLAQDGLKLALVLPQIAGIDGPRHYLILAQNEDELRATGGFISGAGLLVVENGRITALTFQDAYLVDNWQEKPYEVLTSGPLYEFMNLELFLFRDTNIWPNFPTSAETAMNLFSYGLELPPMDGAIAIDQKFLQLLLEVTGPVTIPDENITINRQNLITNLRDAWAIDENQAVGEWIASRKAFLGPFAAALKDKLVGDFASLDPIYLIRNMTLAVETGHLQIYMRDETVAATLEELGWDGRLHPPTTHDYLLALDTNVGYNKVNANIQRSLDYQITLQPDGPAQADLTLTYTHTTPANDITCTATEYGSAPTYQQLANQCLWNYLRLYTPAHSQLLQASQHTIPSEARVYNNIATYTPQTIHEQDGFTTFTNYFLVPIGQTLTSHYRYQLPGSIIQSQGNNHTYQLMLQKQAGSLPPSVQVTVTLPPHSELVSTTPAATAVSEAAAATTLHFSLTLETNSLITVTYQD
ncbi:MAG: DUF4012 domain-containing protein [Ardenticatenaceae bacterium]|nr:DUF4012 domain-containing protein [Ardenticatenaceae bacterium]